MTTWAASTREDSPRRQVADAPPDGRVTLSRADVLRWREAWRRGEGHPWKLAGVSEAIVPPSAAPLQARPVAGEVPSENEGVTPLDVTPMTPLIKGASCEGSMSRSPKAPMIGSASSRAVKPATPAKQAAWLILDGLRRAGFPVDVSPRDRAAMAAAKPAIR